VSASLWGGGYADEQERLIPFLLLFLFIIIYSTLTPSSFIPRSLDLHIRQVDDCVADDKEVMLEGRQVDMQAEEVEEHVRVDLSVGVVGNKNYEEPECRSAANFLLGVEIESNERKTVPAPPTKPSFSLALNERETVPAPPTKPSFLLEPNERETVPTAPTMPLFSLAANEHKTVPGLCRRPPPCHRFARVKRAQDCASTPHHAFVFGRVERARDCAGAPHQAVVFARAERARDCACVDV